MPILFDFEQKSTQGDFYPCDMFFLICNIPEYSQNCLFAAEMTHLDWLSTNEGIKSVPYLFPVEATAVTVRILTPSPPYTAALAFNKKHILRCKRCWNLALQVSLHTTGCSHFSGAKLGFKQDGCKLGDYIRPYHKNNKSKV